LRVITDCSEKHAPSLHVPVPFFVFYQASFLGLRPSPNNRPLYFSSQSSHLVSADAPSTILAENIVLQNGKRPEQKVKIPLPLVNAPEIESSTFASADLRFLTRLRVKNTSFPRVFIHPSCDQRYCFFFLLLTRSTLFFDRPLWSGLVPACPIFPPRNFPSKCTPQPSSRTIAAPLFAHGMHPNWKPPLLSSLFEHFNPPHFSLFFFVESKFFPVRGWRDPILRPIRRGGLYFPIRCLFSFFLFILFSFSIPPPFFPGLFFSSCR